MLSKNEFEILNALRMASASSQRKLAERSGVSLGTVNKVLKSLSERGLIDGCSVTEQGMDALASHKVENAVIMAAGLSSRFAPISYEKPKGCLKSKAKC